MIENTNSINKIENLYVNLDAIPECLLKTLNKEQLQIFSDFYEEQLELIKSYLYKEDSLDYYLSKSIGKDLKLSRKQRDLVTSILKEGLR